MQAIFPLIEPPPEPEVGAYQLFTDIPKRCRKPADPYLISHALHQREHGLEEHVVVTQEAPSFPGGQVKFPDV